MHAGHGPKDAPHPTPLWQALRELHARGILHGDIRTEHVIVKAEDGRWKVMRCGPSRAFVTRLGSNLKLSC
jgi:hypothetical protein